MRCVGILVLYFLTPLRNFIFHKILQQMKAASIRGNIQFLQSTSRRKVIKTLAMGTAGLLLSPNPLLACTRKKNDKLGIALVGLGYYSTDLLAPGLQNTKNCYLAGIVTGTPWKTFRKPKPGKRM